MLDEVLQRYLIVFPEEEKNLSRLLQQIQNNERLNDRWNFKGHVTGSAIILLPDRSQVLLIHHKLFDRWQQPGGHWEDDEANPLQAAQREGKEETGVQIAEYLPLLAGERLVPLDIDSHLVPARAHKNEPKHWHHDFRYVFVAASEAVTPQKAEVNAVRWFSLTASEPRFIGRAIDKLSRLGIAI
jgi:8-oxo-dGTP pyrophosphatase MutT (NUDIX family)